MRRYVHIIAIAALVAVLAVTAVTSASASKRDVYQCSTRGGCVFLERCLGLGLGGVRHLTDNVVKLLWWGGTSLWYYEQYGPVTEAESWWSLYNRTRHEWVVQWLHTRGTPYPALHAYDGVDIPVPDAREEYSATVLARVRLGDSTPAVWCVAGEYAPSITPWAYTGERIEPYEQP